MIGVLVVTHSGLGKELMVCAENVVGKQSALLALGVEGTESPDGFEGRLRAALATMETNAGILVLSDMLGGTPCNVCLRLARDPGCHFELVTGVNLPMLITALANRHYMPLAQLAQKLVDDMSRSAQRPLQRLRDHLSQAG
ncbi:MAG: PTS sugar transporter subunit IIA [Elusimicrobia bacterium]|jgi:PTS system mannose-specific IIA component|nr:PTS sugar transporter subunit IIA [Elusimicrobiota bacterium]